MSKQERLLRARLNDDGSITVLEPHTPEAGDMLIVKPDGSAWIRRNTTPCVPPQISPPHVANKR